MSRLVYFFDSTRMTPGVPSKAAAHIPFPAGTAGFFYFHRPAGAPPAAGEVRFRITRDADPGSFAAGADLRVHGLPWAMDVYPPVQNVRAVFPLLLADGLLAPRELARIEAMAAARPLGHRLARLVYAFGEPFAVRLDVQRRGSRRIMLSVSVLGDEGDTPINLQFTNLGYISPTSGERRTFTAGGPRRNSSCPQALIIYIDDHRLSSQTPPISSYTSKKCRGRSRRCCHACATLPAAPRPSCASGRRCAQTGPPWCPESMPTRRQRGRCSPRALGCGTGCWTTITRLGARCGCCGTCRKAPLIRVVDVGLLQSGCTAD